MPLLTIWDSTILSALFFHQAAVSGWFPFPDISVFCVVPEQFMKRA
jgi:hypothetical protein